MAMFQTLVHTQESEARFSDQVRPIRVRNPPVCHPGIKVPNLDVSREFRDE
jgi:hypothetical protein